MAFYLEVMKIYDMIGNYSILFLNVSQEFGY